MITEDTITKNTINENTITKDIIEQCIKNGELDKNKIKKYFKCSVTEISKKLFEIYNDITETPKCKCGKDLKYLSFQSGFSKTCGNSKCKIKHKERFEITEKPLEFFLRHYKLLIFDEIKYSSPTEYLYCYYNNIEPKKCEICGNKTTFRGFNDGYSRTCSLQCLGKIQDIKDKRYETNIERYGVKVPSQLKEFQEKQKQTTFERYGNYNNYEKYKQTCLEKFGVDNYFKIPGFNQSQPEKYKKISESLKGRKHPNMNVNMKQRINTCLERYGVEHYVQSEEYKQRQKNITDKVFETKKLNGTTNTSKAENEIYELLKTRYKEVIREYKSEKYPFHCDFYIPEIDLYIEYQGFFSHGFKAFFNTKDDLEFLKKWGKKKNSDFYKNAKKIWTVLDVKKREIALKNNLNFLEIFDKTDIFKQIDRVMNGLSLKYTETELKKEYKIIYEKNSNLEKSPNHNKIILNFQKHFFEKENEIYKTNPIIRRKLIQNRIKYLNKSENELTDRELLSGFKISGIYNSYSYFSPHWFKYFIEKYNIKSVYDPFGGWGHRLLGSKNLDLYVYNDISSRTVDGIKKIIDFLNISNTKVYNEDSEFFMPEEHCEALFMCPPYDNLEIYDNKNKDFKELLKNVLKYKCKFYGIIIKENFENLLIEILGNYKYKEIVNFKKSHFGKKINEFLYTWEF